MKKRKIMSGMNLEIVAEIEAAKESGVWMKIGHGTIAEKGPVPEKDGETRVGEEVNTLDLLRAPDHAIIVTEEEVVVVEVEVTTVLIAGVGIATTPVAIEKMSEKIVTVEAEVTKLIEAVVMAL